MLLRQPNNGPIIRGTTDGDALVWDATAGEWFPRPLPGFAKFNGVHFLTGPEVDFVGTGLPVVAPILTLPPFNIVGNTLVLSYKAQCNMLSGGAGGQADMVLDLLLNTIAIPAWQSRYSDLNLRAAPSVNTVATLCLPASMLGGITPGGNIALVLRGTFTGDAGPPANEVDVLTDGLFLQAEDWTL